MQKRSMFVTTNASNRYVDVAICDMGFKYSDDNGYNALKNRNWTLVLD